MFFPQERGWLFLSDGLGGFSDADEVGTAPDDDGRDEEGCHIDCKDEPPVETDGH